jgi:hypothetical protein
VEADIRRRTNQNAFHVTPSVENRPVPEAAREAGPANACRVRLASSLYSLFS